MRTILKHAQGPLDRDAHQLADMRRTSICIVAARVPRIAVHGIRKTCASLLAALDVHPRVAMRILRHSKIALTMEIYTEAPSDATRDALRKLGDWLT